MIWSLLFACTGQPSETAAPADSEAVSCDVDDPDAPTLEITGVPACGERTFGTYCAGCHGPDARGKTSGTEVGPDLSEHVPAHTDGELLFVLLQGQGDMPASGLANDQHAHILAWLRDSFGEYDGQGH